MNKLIYFYSDTCSPCQQMAPIISQLQMAGVNITKINTSSSLNTTQQFNVRSVPTIIKVDNNGNELGRLVGFNTFGTISNFLK